MKKTLLLVGSCMLFSLSHAQVSIVDDIIPGASGGNPGFLTAFNNALYFNAKDGTHGRELWMYNAQTTPSMVYDLNPGGSDGTAMGYDVSNSYVVIGTNMYMTATNGVTGAELYQYNGSGNPVLAADIDTLAGGSSEPQALVAYNGKLYFMAKTPANGSELYRYDPQTQLATRLSDINPGAAGSLENDYQLNNIIPFQGKLYFAATNGTTGYELYSYNPVNDSVNIVSDINAGAAGSAPAGFYATASTLYFTANDGTHGRELFQYSGSNAPAMITDLNPGAANGSAGFPPILFSNRIIFTGNNGTTGMELYELTPGTTTATLLKDIKQGSTDGMPEYYTVNGNRLFFSAYETTHGNELWSWDGTNTPYLIADINTGTGNGDPACMLSWNNKLYMNAQIASTGYELYVFNDSTLGIQNAQRNTSVTVYPVPASDKVVMAINSDRTEMATILLTDAAGRTVYNSNERLTQGKNDIIIGLNDFATGIYFYRLQEKNGLVLAAGRVVKQ